MGIGCVSPRDFQWRNFTRNLGHAFLIIEGVDQYGLGLYFRYNLCLVDSRDVSQGYHVTRNQCVRLNEADRENILYQEVQYNRTAYYMSWEIDPVSEVPKLIRALEADKGRDMTKHYVSLPTSTAAAAADGERKVNCLTWARNHIKAVIGSTYRGELDSGLPIPVWRITERKNPNESTCRIM